MDRPAWASSTMWGRLQKAFPGFELAEVDDLGMMLTTIRPGEIPLAPQGPHWAVFMFDPQLVTSREAIEMIDIAVRAYQRATVLRVQALLNQAVRIRTAAEFYPHDKRRKS